MAEAIRNCPFYGHHFTWFGFVGIREIDRSMPPFNLIKSGGNQCAIVFAAFSPCVLEIEGKPVEWSECPRVEALCLDLGAWPQREKP